LKFKNHFFNSPKKKFQYGQKGPKQNRLATFENTWKEVFA
jgi:hypothetical protein